MLYLVLKKEVAPVEAILKKKFVLIEAAGGIVEKGKKALYIHRLGYWDLPKGKLEKGETIEEGALREVFEECNVEAEVVQHLVNTYHIYKYKKRYVLKRTYWYQMKVIGEPELKPQTEEAIDDVQWFSKKKAKSLVYPNTYRSLKELLDVYWDK